MEDFIDFHDFFIISCVNNKSEKTALEGGKE